jgi:hypothetical protein
MLLNYDIEAQARHRFLGVVIWEMMHNFNPEKAQLSSLITRACRTVDRLESRKGSLYNPFKLDYRLLAVDLVEHFPYHYTRKDWRDKLREMNVRGDSIAPVLEFILSDDDWNNKGFREGTHYYIPNNQWGVDNAGPPLVPRLLEMPCVHEPPLPIPLRYPTLDWSEDPLYDSDTFH